MLCGAGVRGWGELGGGTERPWDGRFSWLRLDVALSNAGGHGAGAQRGLCNPSPPHCRGLEQGNITDK